MNCDHSSGEDGAECAGAWSEFPIVAKPNAGSGEMQWFFSTTRLCGNNRVAQRPKAVAIISLE